MGNKIFYISDLHFRHKNILLFDKRPFGSVEEMESMLISNWNSVVKPCDTVNILGDFCWGKDSDWREIVPKINGNKVLIRGNHDIKEMSAPLKNMFQDVKDYKEITDNQRHVIMCHYPMLFYKSSYNPSCYMLCGHVHTTRENDFLRKWVSVLQETRQASSDSCGQIYNVGCMMPWINYIPRTLDEIINRYKTEVVNEEIQ